VRQFHSSSHNGRGHGASRRGRHSRPQTLGCLPIANSMTHLVSARRQGKHSWDARTGKNGRHALVGMPRQSVFGRLGEYEDVNDAERLRMTGNALAARQRRALRPRRSQMSRFSALTDLSGQWIARVHARRPPRGVVLDMDSSVSPTHGEQEMSVWNGHYECTYYHPLFVDLERCALRPDNVHTAGGC
jgi:hypothetical protein